MNDGEVSLLSPFRALRAVPERAAAVAAPPYDVMTEAEARDRAAGNPWSFVHVSRPEVDLAPGADAHGPDAYAKAAENLARLRTEGALVLDGAPTYSVWRLILDGHAQTGVVGTAPVDAYQAGRIRRHELTRPDKEDDRVRHMEALGAQTGPVMMVHRANGAIADVVRRVTGSEPDVALELDGVGHALWTVTDGASITALEAAFAAVDALYIADGHHRSAAAARVAEARRGKGASADGPWAGFLAVSFPADEVRILDYNRVVRDLGGLSPDDFLDQVAAAFAVESSPAPVKPIAKGEFGLYLAGAWYRLTLRDVPPPNAPALERLDITLLTERVLEPVLAIGDPRSDPRIGFVGGIRGLEELARQVDSGEMAAAFALYPTSLADLMAVADAGGIMPPKSTWFEPKLADGLVSQLLD